MYSNLITNCFRDPCGQTVQMYSQTRPEPFCLMKRESHATDAETEKVTIETKTDGPDHQFQRVEMGKGQGFCSPRSLLIPNYNLKRTLFVYFYHRENISHYDKKYPLTAFELKVLKKFLVKKLIQDKRKFKILNIQNLDQESYAEFLRTNPPVYRKNIIKSKLFKKVVKLMKLQIADFETKYIAESTDLNFDIFKTLDPKKAYNLMTNKFYQLCFSNQTFKEDFLRFINDPSVMSGIISESKKKFNRKIDDWIDMLAQNLNDMCILDEEEVSIKVRLNSSRDEIEEARLCFLAIAQNRSCAYNP